MNLKTIQLSSFLAGLMMWAAPMQAFVGSDDFAIAGPGANWNPSFSIAGAGLLQQNSDGVVRYSSTGSGDESRLWGWQVGLAPLATNWSMQLDVTVPNAISLGGQSRAVGIGLVVINNADANDRMGSVMEEVSFGNPTEFHDFFSFLRINGAGQPELATNAPNDSGAVLIQWDAGSSILSAQYDADGATGGYNWTTLRSFDPTLGGTWNMGGGDSFRLGLLGYSEDVGVSNSAGVKADNFQAVPEPSAWMAMIGPVALLAGLRRRR